MQKSFHGKILKNKGFKKIAVIAYGFRCELWWGVKHATQVSVITGAKDYFAIKTTKRYKINGLTPDGETRIRDLKQLQDIFQSLFPDLVLTLVYLRDPPEEVIDKRIRQVRMRNTGKEDILNLPEMETALQEKLSDFKTAKQKMVMAENVIQKGGDGFELFEKFMKLRIHNQKQQIEKIANEGQKLECDIHYTKRLKKAYAKNSSAVALIVTYSSDILIVRGINNFKDGLHAKIKEVRDAHNHQIMQKLNGSRLSVFVEELRHPGIALQAEWNGFLNPHQMREPFEGLRQEVIKAFEAYPIKDITVDGATKDEKKLVAPKAAQNMLLSVPTIEPGPLTPELPKEGGCIGFTDNHPPILLPSNKGHKFILGTTTGGKTYSGRCVAENAIGQNINFLGIDPTRQLCGLGLSCDTDQVLARYDEFKIPRSCVHGYSVNIFTPGSNAGFKIRNNEKLLTGCNVVSLKELDDKDRCTVLLNILKTVYSSFGTETDGVKLIVAIEEAHSFLPSGVDPEAKKVAKEVERMIIRITREGAKYGVSLLIITQQESDFRASGRAARNMIGTRIVHRNTDRQEEEYIRQYLPKEQIEQLKYLQNGEAILWDAEYFPDGIKIKIRPPLSAVREISDDEIRFINQQKKGDQMAAGIERTNRTSKPDLDEKESKILELVQEVWQEYRDGVLASSIKEYFQLSKSDCYRVLDRMAEKGLIKKVFFNNGPGRPKLGIKPKVLSQ